MSISKAVELLIKFIELNSDDNVSSENDLRIVESKFEKFLKSRHKNISEVDYKIKIAFSNGFLVQNDNESQLCKFIQPTEKFADYILKNENNRIKFIYGLIGSGITVVGGLIGALISAIV